MKEKDFSKGIFILLLIIASVTGLAQEGRFTVPEKGVTINNRQGFLAAIEINNFDISSGFYWTAIASVKEINDNDRNRILNLREQLNNEEDSLKRGEMERLLGKWKIDLFWPKFNVKDEIYEGPIYDGGTNPRSVPQAMILLLLKVDDRLNNYFNDWFDNGPVNHYPGIPVSVLGRNMVITRCEIFFP